MWVPTSRLNAEPPVLLGCSQPELLLLIGVALALWVPLSLAVAIGTGILGFAPALLVIGCISTIPIAANLLVRAKAGRPEGWHIQRVRLALAAAAGSLDRVQTRIGRWDIGR